MLGLLLFSFYNRANWDSGLLAPDKAASKRHHRDRSMSLAIAFIQEAHCLSWQVTHMGPSVPVSFCFWSVKYKQPKGKNHQETMIKVIFVINIKFMFCLCDPLKSGLIILKQTNTLLGHLQISQPGGGLKRVNGACSIQVC